jgi:hypothetical protein
MKANSIERVWPVLMLCLVAPAWAAAASPEFRESGCTSTREYVTTLEFLRAQSSFSLSEKAAREIAETVSKECGGAARRFIRVTSVLSKAELGSKDAVKAGLAFAARADVEADTFVEVFQKAFLKDYLDLDLASSMRMAYSLTTQFEGDVMAVRNDFFRILEFCLSSNGLDLPRPRCGEMAASIARKGQGYSGGIGAPFIQAFEFLKSDKGPKLATADALKLAEQLVASGPGASENFILGYRYAVSKKGLDLAGKDAIAFASQMAERTVAQPRSKR